LYSLICMQLLWRSSPVCSSSVCSMHCNTCDGYSYSTNVYTFKLLVMGSRSVLFLLSMIEMHLFSLFGCSWCLWFMLMYWFVWSSSCSQYK
jgi:hypothetical protein